MEAAIGGESLQPSYGVNSGDLGKRSLEWDPKDWRWDGDLFLATPLDRGSSGYQLFPALPSSNSSSSYSDELNQGAAKDDVTRESEKKRRAGEVEDDLTLNLGGGRGFPAEVAAGKKIKSGGGNPYRPVCQVEDCGADLNEAKDYHRRHKVCEMHSKASKALVGKQIQRFCQQCSRFHALQEFDEGKRSCRRRLAGHNKRRRKTQQTENVGNNIPVIDSQSCGYLLLSILKILSNLHSNGSNHGDDQDLLSHLKQSQDLLNNLPSLGNSELLSVLLSSGSLGQRSLLQNHTTPGDEIPRNDVDVHAMSERPGIVLHTQADSEVCAQDGGSSGERTKLNNFDLNYVYVDSDDATDYIVRPTVPESLGTVSTGCPSWVRQESLQSSPPHTSGRNSDSASAQSQSSSRGEDQSHTDRIVFKLFGKKPSDLPLVLRAQIFDWLSHSPSEIESYIKPGCVVLTIYVRLSDTTWEELYCDLSSSLNRLLNFSDDVKFWSTGWIYARVQNQVVFAYNGQEVVETSLPCGTDNYSTILSVKPIAVTPSSQTEFVVRGINLSRPSTRLLCALEGNYIEAHCESVEHVEGHVQCLKFSCSVPAVTGRGFIEVEDNGLSSSFSPFLVTEYNVCAEIRTLEREMELTVTDNSVRGSGEFSAIEFIQEIGWLFRKYQLKSGYGYKNPNVSLFPFERFNSLVKFSMDRDWCCVVNKLLDILFYGVVSGREEEEEEPFLKFARSEMGLLQRAVRRNSRPLVEMLLRYVPEKVAEELTSEYKEINRSFFFRPDIVGPGGLTPLHVAAGRDGSEDVLDALTDDPGKAGVEAWKNAVDSTGSTPEDYARLRGHYSYIHLVQRKNVGSGHVVVKISETVSDRSYEKGTFEVKGEMCGVCGQKPRCGSGNRGVVYRPAMVSMLAVAAVCVCVALFFKSLREVSVHCPFRWEMLQFGSS